MVLLTRIPILDRCKKWFKARGFVSKISVDRCCCCCNCCCYDGIGVPFILLKVKLHFSQRRWSLAEGKSEASLFSTTGSDTMIEIIEDKNNN
uniref:Uncharacterized protein n=1 Tax=Musa acuminata subsp. malaccensis TaxID=214687 RepID=A0A804JIH7_MUSAM